jgi:hypothetical protein
VCWVGNFMNNRTQIVIYGYELAERRYKPNIPEGSLCLLGTLSASIYLLGVFATVESSVQVAWALSFTEQGL